MHHVINFPGENDFIKLSRWKILQLKKLMDRAFSPMEEFLSIHN